jgi:putative transposase
VARLPRLEWPGHTHYLLQRAHGGLLSAHAAGLPGAFADAADRSAFLAALREAAVAEQVQVHAYALLPTELQLLATPGPAGALGRLMQALGRRYVSAYNRRHNHRGSLWDGRFRCAVVEPGALRLQALLLVDGQSDQPGWTSASAPHRRAAREPAGRPAGMVGAGQHPLRPRGDLPSATGPGPQRRPGRDAAASRAGGLGGRLCRLCERGGRGHRQARTTPGAWPSAQGRRRRLNRLARRLHGQPRHASPRTELMCPRFLDRQTSAHS